MEYLHSLTNRFKQMPFGPDTVIPEQEPRLFKAGMPYKSVLSAIAKGNTYCFVGTYGTAMGFYSWLKKQINAKFPIIDYQSSKLHKLLLTKYTDRLLIGVRNQQADLSGAPHNDLLGFFYPEKEHYYIRFTDFLGLNGAWQWFKNGIAYPGLHHTVHPFYGVYFPTRTDHLELFNQWIGQQSGFKNALDMGAGCGVLSFYMLQHAVQHITATDINFNSLFSIALDLERLGMTDRMVLKTTTFFDGVETADLDLVVFNPPWIPQSANSIIDKAMYYDDGFFTQFFDEANEKLQPACVLVILFSNFAQLAGLRHDHPIEHELKQNRFTRISKIHSNVNQPISHRKNWLATIRSTEKNELWVLSKNS